MGRIIGLVIATVAVLLAIAAVGDIHHHQQAMDQARWHAGVLASRLGPNKTLPLNLEPEPVPERRSGMFALETLTTQQAAKLRGHTGALIVAQTVPQPMRLAPDGRAVIIFKNGEFHVEWMTLNQFTERMQSQVLPLLRDIAVP